MVTNPKMCKLLASNGSEFLIEESLLRQECTLVDMKFSESQEVNEKPMALPALSADVLEVVLAFVRLHKDSEKYKPPTHAAASQLDAIDEDFVSKVENSIFIDVINGAHVLGCERLVDAGLLFLRKLITGLDLHSIRELCKLECDITPDDVEKLNKDVIFYEDSKDRLCE